MVCGEGQENPFCYAIQITDKFCQKPGCETRQKLVWRHLLQRYGGNASLLVAEFYKIVVLRVITG